MVTARQAVGAAAAAVYVADCVHVHGVLTERRRRDEEPAEVELVAAVEAHYQNGEVVDHKAYATALGETQQAAEEAWQGFGSEAQRKLLEVQRESVVFLGGGRAALLQIAHPYVASGVATHSNLANGVHERFTRTFLYVFPMIFGNPKAGLQASRAVRGLHARVKGKVGENVGMFDKDHVYDANHAHALLWVHLTLIDSSIFLYELMVRRLDKRDKDNMVRVSNLFGRRFFGIPAHLLPQDYAGFGAMCNAIVQSNVVAVGATGRKIDGFLWTPPKSRYWPLLALTRWLTFVLLPNKVAREYYGVGPTKLEVLLSCLVLGQVRFVYRLLPRPFRWLSSYMRMEEEQGVRHSTWERSCAAASAAVANWGLDVLMPPRKAKALQ